MDSPAYKCGNPRCGNVIEADPHKRGGRRIYCSKKCGNAVNNARYTARRAGRQYPPPVVARTRAQQLRAYFDLLMRLTQKARGEQLNDLFDRLERTLTEIDAEDARPIPCGLGWPA